MLQPLVHCNSDGPNRNGSSFDLSQDEDDFNMDRNWEHGLDFVFFILLYFFHKVLFCRLPTPISLFTLASCDFQLGIGVIGVDMDINEDMTDRN